MRRIAALTLALALWLGMLAPAGAVEPGEMLADPALEARARQIGKELRCLVCQNQSIDDSGAPLAKDLRLLVRERLVAGASDAQVVAFVTERYGDFVRLRPPFKPATWALWLGPAAILMLGIGAIAMGFRRRRRRTAEPAPLSAEERRRFEALFDDAGRP